MKGIVGWFVGLVLIGGSAFGGLQAYKSASGELAYHKTLSEEKIAFAQKSAGVVLLDDETYAKEIGILLTKYFNDLRSLDKAHPGLQDFEREYARGAEEVAANRMSESQKMMRDERVKISLDLLNLMRSGQYRPIYTSQEKGFRFDIFDMGVVQGEGGQPAIRAKFVQWGAFGPINYNTITGTFGVEIEEGKPVEIPQIVGDGQPPTLNFDPSDWVAEFFPGIQTGYYEFPLFPPQAKSIDLEFGYDIRTIGGTAVPVMINFKQIAIPDAWKVGGDWKAKERFASDEELKALGVDPQVKVQKKPN